MNPLMAFISHEIKSNSLPIKTFHNLVLIYFPDPSTVISTSYIGINLSHSRPFTALKDLTWSLTLVPRHRQFCLKYPSLVFLIRQIFDSSFKDIFFFFFKALL